MKKRLLELLACPKCSNEFKIVKGQFSNGELDEGLMQCISCGDQYPIVNGIPRMLKKMDSEYYKCCRNYEYQWTKMNWFNPELTSSRFYELTGLDNKTIKGKVILDVGTGGGRWAYQLAKRNAGDVVAFDYTEAVDYAKNLCSEFNNIHFVQADIYSMPYKKDSFDIIHAHGVLHNLPEPEIAMKNLSYVVKKKGLFVFLVFRNLTKVQTIIDHSISWFTSRLPIKLMYYLCFIPTIIEYIPGTLFLLKNIFYLSGQPGFSRKHYHNYDWYTSRIKHRMSPLQAKQIMQHLGFSEINILKTNGFRVKSRFSINRKIRKYLLKKGFFLNATLGVKAVK